jgi:hypothetical protein
MAVDGTSNLDPAIVDFWTIRLYSEKHDGV